MLPVEIRSGIFWIGSNDHTTDLFEGLWPIKEDGISYNSYLINDEKKAIIDLTNETLADDLLDHIAEIIDLSSLDYVIVNHIEPDHTGALLALRRIAPEVVIIGTEKTRKMLQKFYDITEGIQVVQHGDTLELGKHTLRFLSTPNVHWPETMMTYDEQEKILFSCDGFGGYGALHGSIFDDESMDIEYYEEGALRYYANIVASFSNPVLTAIGKASEYDISMVAPSHGLVWRKEPQRIISLYKQWAEYASGISEKGITLLYGSMYRNTEKMVDIVAQGIVQEGVPLEIFDTAHVHVSYILPAVWVNQGVIVGSPTYEGFLFPEVTAALEMLNLKRFRNKHAAYFGSYGWGGGARRHFERYAETLKWEVVDTFDFAGGPKGDDLQRGREFGADFARKIVSLE